MVKPSHKRLEPFERKLTTKKESTIMTITSTSEIKFDDILLALRTLHAYFSGTNLYCKFMTILFSLLVVNID